MDSLISIVVPAYNEEHIKDLIDEIDSYVADYEVEYIIVDDGSSDKTWDEIERLAENHKNLYGISFSRNFGKEAAILAGLSCSNGEAVITIDADLQHPPEKLPEFIKKWEAGYKIVEGIKKTRGEECVTHGIFSKLFYKVMSNAVGSSLSDTSDFKLLDKEVVDLVLHMPEKQMFYRAITSWIGFKSEKVEYDVQERKYGKSKWNTYKLFKYAIRNVTSFSTAPLQVITIFSILFLILALIFGSISLIKYFTGQALEGFTTVILLQLIIGSILMLALGLIGYYIAKIFDETRNRPRYIIERRTRDKDEEGCANSKHIIEVSETEK